MHEFGQELNRAMEAYVNRHYGSDCSHDCSEETETKIRTLFKQKEDRTMTKNRKRMTRWIGVIAACAVLMCSAVVVYAASPAVREYLNSLFLKEDSAARLNEVPDGYTGIYTAADLDAVRENLGGKYILMNDITLTEDDFADGGFVPIGNQNYPFTGIFNGNGYVIRGLRVNGDYDYAGLFGYVKWTYVNEITEEYDPEEPVYIEDGGIAGLTKSVTGMVRNLGLADCVIEIAGVSPKAEVGAIAGHGDFIVGCFTENTEITLDLSAYEGAGSYAVGGVVGAGYLIDSCWSDADVRVISDNTSNEVLAAGVAGQSYACVTSYFSGTVDAGIGEDCGVTGLYDLIVPVILSDTILNEVDRRYQEQFNEPGDVRADFEIQRLKSFYLSLAASNFDNEFRFFTGDIEGQRVLLLDPDTKPREHRLLSSLLEVVFPEDSFNQFCKENSIKCGYYYCYDLRETPECTFEGFDTGSIWYIADDGMPRLRLFSGGSAGLYS
ncbi:MAG: hypothetical protein IJ497_02945 [Clostridia bacterium]|nr:hypothetical protein [Clostridia bacterium]